MLEVTRDRKAGNAMKSTDSCGIRCAIFPDTSVMYELDDIHLFNQLQITVNLNHFILLQYTLNLPLETLTRAIILITFGLSFISRSISKKQSMFNHL